MHYCPFRIILISGLILIGLSLKVLAQCPSPDQLYETLQRLSAQDDLGAQVKPLQAWKQQWAKCGYPPDSTYINGLLLTGVAYLYRNDLVAATHFVSQAVKLSQTHRLDVSIDQPAKSLYRLGMLLSEQNQQRQAVIILRQAVSKGQNIPSAARWVGGAYLYLAYDYYSAGDFQRAADSAEGGEKAAEQGNDKPLLAKILEEKAKVLNVLHQYGAARKAAEKAVELAEQGGYLAVAARGYKLLGGIAENQEQLADALRYRQRAFTIAQAIHDYNLSDYAGSLGELYYKLKQYDQANYYFLFDVKNATDLSAKAYALTMLGMVHWQKKSFLKALQYYQKGLISMPIGFKNSAISSLPDARSIHQADQKEYLLTLIQNKADTWLDYAKATKNKQRFQYALDTYKVADQMIDFMRWEHTGQLSKLYWRQKTRGMYERAIETCYLLNDAEEAFRFLEKSRAVMLADKLNELGARQQLTQDQAAQEQLLQKSVSDQQSKLAGLSPDSSRYKSVQSALQIKQDSLYDFLQQLEASNPAYYRYKYDNTTPSLSELQRYLKKQQTSLITYFVGDSALYVLGVMADSVRLTKQPIKRYSLTLNQFTPLLGHPEAMSKRATVRQFWTLSHDLYSQLLEPLALPKGRVVVSPDGFFIPFDALSRSKTQADYAVTDYAFSYAYSASLLLKNGARPNQLPRLRTGGFLGVAPVDFASSLKQVTLPGSDNALKSIAERFDSPLLLTHKAATRKAFQQDAPAYSVVLLFTHATADSTDQEPMLYFADSTLRLSDLGDGALPNAQLVVLAACKTGIGANQQGEGVFSLARGFSALGVPSVLTTLWSVENKATYQLTALFYKYLDEGLPKDIALQRAKQDWLKTADGASQLPNYWAGLIIVGDAEPLARSSYWLWIGVVLSLLISSGVGFWVWKKRRVTRAVSSLRPV